MSDCEGHGHWAVAYKSHFPATKAFLLERHHCIHRLINHVYNKETIQSYHLPPRHGSCPNYYWKNPTRCSNVCILSRLRWSSIRSELYSLERYSMLLKFLYVDLITSLLLNRKKYSSPLSKWELIAGEFVPSGTVCWLHYLFVILYAIKSVPHVTLRNPWGNKAQHKQYASCSVPSYPQT